MAKYKYTEWKPRSWDDVENHYLEWFSQTHKKMIELVRHIKKTGASQRLFALTSHDKLIVTIYDKIDVFKEALHITYIPSSDEFYFEYYAVPFQDPEFVRYYEGNIGMQKFDEFLEKVKW